MSHNNLFAAEKIQLLLETAVSVSSCVGLVVGIVEHGKTNYYTHGKKSIDSDEPIGIKHMFEIGSITKCFTTLIMMDLIYKGLLKLDSPIKNYLPQQVVVPIKNGGEITIRHLASHTSGLPRNPKDCTSFQMLAEYPIDELYAFFQTHTLAYKPGTHWEYSNIGMGLLGHILERVTGTSYAQLVQEVICQPLKMHHTTTTLNSQQQPLMADGHHMLNKVASIEITGMPGCGAIRSTVENMVLFLKANMQTEGPADLMPLMQSCQTEQHAVTPWAKRMYNYFISGAPIWKSCLGWQIFQTKTSSIILHDGRTNGYGSFIGFNAVTNHGVVILTNATDAPATLGLHLLDPQNYPFKLPSYNKELANTAYLGALVGTYDDASADRKEITHMSIDLNGEKLVATLGISKMPIQNILLVPERQNYFTLFGFPATYNFTIDAHQIDKPTTILLQQPGLKVVFTKR